MVASLFHCVEDIAVLDQMPAPTAIANIDPGAGDVIDGAMSHRDVPRHRDFDPGALFFDAASSVDETIVDDAIAGIVVAARSGFVVDLGVAVPLVVFKKRGLRTALGLPTKETPLAPAFSMRQP